MPKRRVPLESSSHVHLTGPRAQKHSTYDDSSRHHASPVIRRRVSENQYPKEHAMQQDRFFSKTLNPQNQKRRNSAAGGWWSNDWRSRARFLGGWGRGEAELAASLGVGFRGFRGFGSVLKSLVKFSG